MYSSSISDNFAFFSSLIFLTTALLLLLLLLIYDLQFNLINLLIWSIGTYTALSIIIYQITNRKCFTLLTFFCLLFCFEISVGYLISIYPHSLLIHSQLDSRLVTITLLVSTAAFFLCLLGYKLGSILLVMLIPLFKNKRHMGVFQFYLFPSRYRRILLGIAYAILCLKVEKIVRKVEVAGDFSSFMNTLMHWRFGTFAETYTENAVVVLIGILATPFVAFCCLGFYMIIQRSLSTLERLAWTGLIIAGFVISATSLFRSVLFTFLLAMVGTYDLLRPLAYRRIIQVGFVLVVALVFYNFLHYYLFHITGIWERLTFSQSIQFLLAPQGHFSTLGEILATELSGKAHLLGKGWLESVFFFVPRFVWTSKMSDYGLLAQTWAGLPDWYQQAPTNTGELVAHWGWLGILGTIVYGFYFCTFDKLKDFSPELSIGVIALVLPRVLVDVGMGFPAVCITLFSFVEFCILIRISKWFAGIRLPRGRYASHVN